MRTLAEGKFRLAGKSAIVENIKYDVCLLEDFVPKNQYNVIASIFFHLPPPMRKVFHNNIKEWLAPEGFFIIEAFTPSQVLNKRNSGGPPTIEMMDAESELVQELSFLEIVYCKELEVQLDEGPYHSGTADVVRFIGQKN